MRAEKRPHEWLVGILGVLGLAPSARTSYIKQKVLKGYTIGNKIFVKSKSPTLITLATSSVRPY